MDINDTVHMMWRHLYSRIRARPGPARFGGTVKRAFASAEWMANEQNQEEAKKIVFVRSLSRTIATKQPTTVQYNAAEYMAADKKYIFFIVFLHDTDMDLICHFYVDGSSNKFVCLCINNKFIRIYAPPRCVCKCMCVRAIFSCALFDIHSAQFIVYTWGLKVSVTAAAAAAAATITLHQHFIDGFLSWIVSCSDLRQSHSTTHLDDIWSINKAHGSVSTFSGSHWMLKY